MVEETNVSSIQKFSELCTTEIVNSQFHVCGRG
jgi:hypothetical protein